MLPIAIDVMSGDHEPREYLAGALRALADDAELRVLLVGEPGLIAAALAGLPQAVRERAAVIPATQVVAMDEKPREAIRRKKDSSMRLAVDQVHEGRASACVSAGNTGALTAIAHFVLKTLPGVERAAIISAIPAAHGLTHMLDLGANTKATPEQLRQFAAMGSIVARDVYGVAEPRIGLLNIGEEDIKGNEVVKQAAELLKSSGLNFHGNVEGTDIYRGTTDVIVCDGFVGNVALKTSEGLAQMLADYLREEFTRTAWRRLLAVFALPMLNSFKRRVDPRRYNGATLIGLRGVVIKSHGGADALAFRYALKKAHAEVANGVLERIAQRLSVTPGPVTVAPAGSGNA